MSSNSTSVAAIAQSSARLGRGISLDFGTPSQSADDGSLKRVNDSFSIDNSSTSAGAGAGAGAGAAVASPSTSRGEKIHASESVTVKFLSQGYSAIGKAIDASKEGLGKAAEGLGKAAEVTGLNSALAKSRDAIGQSRFGAVLERSRAEMETVMELSRVNLAEAFGLEVPESIRLIDRSEGFHQSRDEVSVKIVRKRWTENCAEKVRLTYLDTFHTLISLPTTILYIVVVLIYTAQVIFFALVYLALVDGCTVTKGFPLTFAEAFAFSLETSTTVGYFIPFVESNDDFFQCPSWLLTCFAQMMLTLVLNAVLTGLVLVRVTRADRRAKKVVFSNKACMVCIRGKYYFICQAFDIDGVKPVIGASVKMVCVFHEHETSGKGMAHFQTRGMRILHPDDELGAKLFLSIPSTIIHQVDAWSPLLPPQLVRRVKGLGTNPDALIRSQATLPSFPGRILREPDGYTGGRSISTCTACGSTFLDINHLERHIRYQILAEESAGGPEKFGNLAHSLVNLEASHLKIQFSESMESKKAREIRKRVTQFNRDAKSSLTFVEYDEHGKPISKTSMLKIQPSSSDYVRPSTAPINPEEDGATTKDAKEALKKYFQETKLEVIVMIEGSDPKTSSGFQARHSYCYEDIVFDHLHVPCMSVTAKGSAEVLLDLFHEIEPCAEYIEETPLFASKS